MEKRDLAQKYGDAWLKKNRRKRQKLLVAEMFFDFAENTTLHGLRYTTQRGLSVIEKIFWLITFLISIGICSYLISNLYIKWQYSPVIVTLNEKLISVGMVPFPSVTICPQMKCKSTVYNYTHQTILYSEKYQPNAEMNENGTSSADNAWAEKLEDISIICETGSYFESERDLANVSLVDHILEVSPENRDIFRFCIWRSELSDCTPIFERVITAEGVCYNMNGLAANELFRENIQDEYEYLSTSTPSRNWSTSDGYSVGTVSNENDTSPNPYPRRGRENGANPDLIVFLKQYSPNLDAFCNGINSGYKIYIQHPADLPQSSLNYYSALPNQVSSVALKANIFSTDKSLKDHTADIRQCYFAEERYLRYFRIYTANNCRMECLSNYTYRLCHCVAYYMPHDNSSEICTSKKMHCISAAQEILADDDLKSPEVESEACRCLPVCNSIDYEAEILKTDYNLKTYQMAIRKTYGFNVTYELSDHEYTKIEIYFKRPSFISMRRSELYGVTDFMANCGGLLGLFLGFSFLSLVEIFYFLTLRLGCTLKRDLEKERKDKKTKEEKY